MEAKMFVDSRSLVKVFEGWEGYQASLVRAVAPLTPKQLAWGQSARVRTLGQLACHIAFARIDWFKFMDAPGSAEAMNRITRWETDDDGNQWIAQDTKSIVEDAGALVDWLEASWLMIEKTLGIWSVSDLDATYRHTWNGETYVNSRQWTIWRIMAHDIHHGGQIARILAEQDIEAFELRGLGGHIVMPPLAAAKES
jgi:uncharacterized damage-inducible protein DinB